MLEHMFLSYQVKATAENVDGAVRELPDANLVRYSSLFRLIIHMFIIAGFPFINVNHQTNYSSVELHSF